MTLFEFSILTNALAQLLSACLKIIELTRHRK